LQIDDVCVIWLGATWSNAYRSDEKRVPADPLGIPVLCAPALVGATTGSAL
jgi:hypothetical protein